MDELEIYFDDLKPEAQKKLLELHGISGPDEANWDVFPIFVIPKPEPEIIEEGDDE